MIFKVLKAESESRNGVRPGSRGGSLLKEGGRRIFCDPLGRRIQKEVTIGSQNKTTNFYYSGHQVKEGDRRIFCFETENGHIEVVVDPAHMSPFVGICRDLPLDTSTTIVHEFGHAYANMFGFYNDLLATQLDFLDITKREDPMFFELAVMFENLFRLRLNQRYLRGWHQSMTSKMEVE